MKTFFYIFIFATTCSTAVLAFGPSESEIPQTPTAVTVGEPFVLHTISDYGHLWPVFFRYNADDNSLLGFSNGFLEAVDSDADSDLHHDYNGTKISSVPLILRYDQIKNQIQVLNSKDLVPSIKLSKPSTVCLQMTKDQLDYTIGSCDNKFYASNFIRKALEHPAGWIQYTQHLNSLEDSFPIKRCMSFRAQSYYYYSRSYQSINPNCISNSLSHNKFFFKEVDPAWYKAKSILAGEKKEMPEETTKAPKSKKEARRFIKLPITKTALKSK